MILTFLIIFTVSKNEYTSSIKLNSSKKNFWLWVNTVYMTQKK